ncbi:helix-turn-helix transcriptional regulator [Streptomyces sp. NBC_01003]|uniref:helix-turn-helix domain-containing protein n=1 Tax=Streptomyces sp. NBC_01003 TaxID=2903714 RepID=UPI00386B4AF5|nr:helix-turn-helix transcriptional regulator [Streptomyces sp. NBC_01003]
METELKAARRARGWTQAQLMDAMEDAAPRIGFVLPSRASLKTQVSMFENGRRPPGPEYQALFCEVYEATRKDLGFALEAAPSQLDALPKLPMPRGPAPTANAATLDYLKSVFVQHSQAEPLVGPRFLVHPVLSQVPLIEQLCRDAAGPMRGDVLRVGLRYAEFLGWLYQDSGDSQEAMLWTNRALDYAYELDEPTLNTYVLQRRANIATEAGHAGYAQGLANAALKHAGKIPGQVEAVALRARANALAVLGSESETARALDEARALADRSPDDDEGLASYVSVAYIDMEAANCAIELNRPEDAVKPLEDSLTRWPAQQQRDRGLCLARLATAYALNEDLESAVNAATQAVSIAQATGSARILAELTRLQTHLEPFRKLVEIAELNRVVGSMKGT